MNGARTTPALLLLIKVNCLQSWRRLLAVRTQSRLLTFVIAAFIVGYLGISFWLFRLGLGFIGSFPGFGPLLIERMLFMLFAFLFILLIFSNLVIGYTNLFRNRETVHLLSMPVSVGTIYQWKLVESMLLASWAFLFLIAPLLAAYGLAHEAPWHFYPLTVGLIVLFVILPGVAGSWLAVLLGQHLDRRAFQWAAVAGAIALVICAVVWLRPGTDSEQMPETRVIEIMDRLLVRTQFAHYPLLPSYWLSNSVLHWVEGARGPAAFFMMVLLSHALFFGHLAFTRSGPHFFQAFSRVHSRGNLFRNPIARGFLFSRGRERIWEGGLAERMLALLPGVSVSTRALLLKDCRMFWRDTTQWGQTLVLFGLLGVYIINLRHFSQNLSNPFWIHLISYLNLGACALNLATLTTRFVFPQFSLEGKRLWIIGMAPLGLEKVIRVKYWMAGVAALLVTAGLTWLSCAMLNLEWARTIYFIAAVTVMTFSLTGLAVGLGVLYPNLKEDNPSKIVSGFGGTFCLVLSFLYIALSVTILAFGSPWGWRFDPALSRVAASSGLFVFLSILIGFGPMRVALRKIRAFEP
jgi:ABC-2 type transport system permease protein